MYLLLKSLVLPPGINIVLILLGLLLMPLWRGFGIFLIFFSLVTFYLLSTSMGASYLSHSLDRYPPLNLNQLSEYSDAKAIVVLGGGVKYAPELDGKRSSASSLMRASYAAKLYEKTNLPILIAGGMPDGGKIAESKLIKKDLESMFNVPTVWLDLKSKNTFENVVYLTSILDDKGINSFYLVTSASHMPRAMWSFERLGFEPIAAPTDYGLKLREPGDWKSWLPSAKSYFISSQAIREYVGLCWYKMVYR